MKKLTYAVAEAASALGVSKSRIYGLVKDNKLPAVKDGTKILIRAEALEAYLDSLPEVA